MKRLKPLPKSEIAEQVDIQERIIALHKTGLRPIVMSRQSGVSLDYLMRIINKKELPVYKVKAKLKLYLKEYTRTIVNILKKE